MRVAEIHDRAGNLLAMIIRGDIEDGRSFLTPEDFPLQIGTHKRSAGYSIRPHTHTPYERKVLRTMEVLFIYEGEVWLDLYDCEGLWHSGRMLTGGDVVLLVGGGHGMLFVSASEILEVKNGPYGGKEEDKRYLDSRI